MTGVAKPVVIYGDVGDGLVRMLGAMGFSPTRTTDPAPTDITEAVMVVCATEDDRSLLEQRFPAATGKTVAGGSPLQVVTRLQPDRDVPPPPVPTVTIDVELPEALRNRLRFCGRFDLSDDPERAAVAVRSGTSLRLAGPPPPDQRVILHLGDDVSGWEGIDAAAVDAVVVHRTVVGDAVAASSGWPRNLFRVIPPPVDDFQFGRSKHSDARFTLGLASLATEVSIDRACDVLMRLRRDDRRYRLYVKDTTAWSSGDADTASWPGDVGARINADPLLADGIVVSRPGRDTATWLRGIGVALAPANDMAFPTGVAEAMASGAAPVAALDGSMSDTIDGRWLHPVEDLAAAILELNVSERHWNASGAAAQTEAAARWGFDLIAGQWIALLAGVD